MPSKKIALHVSAEVSPFHKTGGLGEVMAGLPSALRRAGRDTRIVTPLYKVSDLSSLREVAWSDTPLDSGERRKWPAPVSITLGWTPIEVEIQEACTHGGTVTTYFVSAPHLSRGGLYGHADDTYRFAILGRAAVAIAEALIAKGTEIGIIHAHDWHAAIAIYYASIHPELANVGSVFTIHNLAFQGREGASLAPHISIPPDALARNFEFFGKINMMKAGIVLASRVTTVSPTYAREICTPAFGHGLDGLLRHVSQKLSGITNGIDTDDWNPETDRHLAAPFSVHDTSSRAASKIDLCQSVGIDPNGPVMTVVSRLTSQKGIDWLLDCAPDFIRRGGRIAILGEGDGGLENRCRQYCRQFSGAFGYWARYEDSVSRKFFGGADLFAMPSRFEPCGLGQLYAMRYGAIPVARRTGGLNDTIFALLNKFDVGGATGILYDGDRTDSLMGALRWALDVARDEGAMAALRQNAMSVDHSWEQSAKRYLALYESIEQSSAAATS